MRGDTIDLLASGARGSRPRAWGKCRDCRQDIRWCETPAGKRIPFNGEPIRLRVNGAIETVSALAVHLRTCPARGQREAQRRLPEAPPDRRFRDD